MRKIENMIFDAGVMFHIEIASLREFCNQH
jgi:hypothetical protein